MRCFRVICFGLVLLAAGVAAAERVQLMSTPCPSPDGRQIAFTWRGDIWVVSSRGGEARPVTRHPANEYRPVFSPDGKQIAFQSFRSGNADVYVVDARGGVPKRLTFHDDWDAPHDWTPDGKHVLIGSARSASFPKRDELFTVDLEGHQPQRITTTGATGGRYTRDGKRLFYSRNVWPWWRQGYRGSENTQIWIADADGKNHRRLTRGNLSESSPIPAPDGKHYYFISEHGGRPANLYLTSLAGGKPKRLTDLKPFPARFGRISRNGRIIAFLAGGDLYVHDVPAGKTRKLNVSARADYAHNPILRAKLNNGATEFDVSPDGKQIAFAVRGEIFVTRTDGSSSRRITKNPALDHALAWHPKGKSLLFCSDRNGTSSEMFTATGTDPQRTEMALSLSHKVEQLTRHGKGWEYVAYSPDGEWIAGMRDWEFVLLNVKTKKVRNVSKGPYIYSFTFSPDSKWLCYSRHDEELGSDLYIESVDGRVKPVNITKYRTGNDAVSWSRDGKFITFIANRNDLWRLYRLDLKKDIPDETYGLDEPKKAPATKPATKPTTRPATAPATHPTTKPKKENLWRRNIDFSGITDRAHVIAELGANIWDATLSPNGETVAFLSDALGTVELWTVPADGGDLRRITNGDFGPSSLVWSPRSNALFFLDSDGQIRRVAPSGGSVGAVGFAVRMDIDRRAEYQQMFRQSWWYLNRNFYDPKFHGVDWPAMRRRYEPLARAAETRFQLYWVIQMMMGELNASHLGIWKDSDNESAGPKTGVLALGLRSEEGLAGQRITAILPNGPCGKRGVNLRRGDVLVAIDDQPVAADTNLSRLLSDRDEELTRLTVARGKAGKLTDRRTVVVVPTNGEQLHEWMYDMWLERNARTVTRLSDGAFAYAHLRDMEDESLERFRRQLLGENLRKKGLVLDVRGNQGGFVDDALLDMLRSKRHTRYLPRRGRVGSHLRAEYRRWAGPVILLIDEHTFSDGEIFANAFRELGLGKIVGLPTSGGVIATWETTLIDGSTLRVPDTGAFTADGTNLENLGIRPDVRVENHPDALAKGRDQQLEEAVKLLLEQAK